MQLVNGNDLLVEAVGVVDVTDLAASVALCTGEVEGGSLVSGANHSPDLVDVGVGYAGGLFAVVGVGIVGFRPKNGLVGSRAELVVAGSHRAGIANGISLVVTGAVIGYGHILGIAADRGAAGTVEDLTVVIECAVGALLRIIAVGVVENVRPEVVLAAFFGNADVLRRVKTEAVGAAVDAFSEVSLDVVLDLGVLGVEVRQTAHTAVGDAVAVAVVDLLVPQIVPAVVVVTDIAGDDACLVIAAVVAKVVGYNVNDDVDAVLVRFLAHGGEFRLRAESGVSGVVNGEVSRLIINPPNLVGLALGAFLCLLDNRGLHRGIARFGNLLHVCLDVVEGPLPSVKNNALLGSLHQSVACGDGIRIISLSRNNFICCTRGSSETADSDAGNQHAYRKQKACQSLVQISHS